MKPRHPDYRYVEVNVDPDATRWTLGDVLQVVGGLFVLSLILVIGVVIAGFAGVAPQ